MPTQRFRLLLPVVAITLLAFALRLWNINFGLPYLYHPDEPRYIGVALHLFQTRDIDPNAITDLSINAFVYTINALAYAAYYEVGHTLGVLATPADIAPLEVINLATGRAPMPSLVLYSRLLTTLFGTGAVFILYWVGRAFACNAWVGIIAALLLAVSPGNVIHSKFVVPDEMLIFFVCLALWLSIQIVQRAKTSDYLLAGMTLGFALSTKLTGAILIVPLGLAHLWQTKWRVLNQPKLYLALLTTLLAFALFTPFIFIDPSKVYTDWQSERSHYAVGHPGMEGDTLAWYVSYLWRIEGPLFIVSVVGLLLGLYRNFKQTTILGALLVFYLLIIGMQPVRNDRTILLALPLFALFAAYGVTELWTLSKNNLAQRYKFTAYATLIALSCILVGWPLTRSIAKNIELGTVDGRALAQAWLPTHLPQGSKVAIEDYSPFVDPALYQVESIYRITRRSPEWYIEQGFDYLILSEGAYGRFFREPQLYAAEIDEYNNFFNRFELVERFEDAGYGITFVDSGYEIRIYKVEAAQ